MISDHISQVKLQTTLTFHKSRQFVKKNSKVPTLNY